MTDHQADLNSIFNRHFLTTFPADAALQLEALSVDEVISELGGQPASVLVPAWCRLVSSQAAKLTLALPEQKANEILALMPPNDAVRIVTQLSEDQQSQVLGRLKASTRRELKRLMSYPDGCAGRLMDTRVDFYRGSSTVESVLARLRQYPMKTVRSLYLVDEAGKITSRVLLQDLVQAELTDTLGSLAQPILAAVQVMASKEEIAELFATRALLDLPVVDMEGVLVGVIVHASLLQTVQEDTLADVQAMVGASREERALSSPLFAVKKRMPWLQVNLLTAFLAAAVVGVFESTIAQVTALAVLLPVVAGQSGNAGAQALAVTMRGLALREITIRHWLAVMFKEVRVGFFNGLGIALTCGLGVYVWSGSIGLVVVISLSMVIGMVAAGLAGSLVPIALVRLGQDPAQSSSIILTTVTDIAGFFSFLGIATLMMGML
jgi:magnesium transporter